MHEVWQCPNAAFCQTKAVAPTENAKFVQRTAKLAGSADCSTGSVNPASVLRDDAYGTYHGWDTAEVAQRTF